MSVNYEISDIFNYVYTGTVSATTTGTANANTGLLYRAASNDDEVRVLGPSSTVGQVLTVTATNIIGWQTPTQNTTPFLVRPAIAQSIASSALSSFTSVVWGTETIDLGSTFAANVYTLPSSGAYFLSAALNWSVSNKSNKGERHARIVQDPAGTPVVLAFRAEQPNSDKTIDFFQTLSTLYNGTAAQTIGVQVSQNSGVTNDIGTDSQFFGWKIN